MGDAEKVPLGYKGQDVKLAKVTQTRIKDKIGQAGDVTLGQKLN